MPFRERAGQGSVTNAVLLEKVKRFPIHVCGEKRTPAVPAPQTPQQSPELRASESLCC